MPCVCERGVDFILSVSCSACLCRHCGLSWHLVPTKTQKATAVSCPQGEGGCPSCAVWGGPGGLGDGAAALSGVWTVGMAPATAHTVVRRDQQCLGSVQNSCTRVVLCIHLRVWAARVACWWVAALNNTQPCNFVGEACAWPPVPLTMVGAWYVVCCPGSFCAARAVGHSVWLVWCVWVSACVDTARVLAHVASKLLGSFSEVY